ncbi:MAG: CBS domain-containing protein [Bacteroidales bacterium]|nr:CBS domain-containing protein [Bacteroidales bacterium]
MIVKEIISDEILPLRTSDTCNFAIRIMEENRVNHLPVVNESDLLGLVSDFDLVNHADLAEPIGNVRLTLLNAFISEYHHVYDAMKMITERRLSLLPVVDHRNAYAGIITLPNLIEALTTRTSVLSPGGIIVLEMADSDYSMAEIARIVESNDARILNFFVDSKPDSTLMDLTLKINADDLSLVIQTLQRYQYRIKATFAEKDDLDELKERYDSLMSYLGI